MKNKAKKQILYIQNLIQSLAESQKDTDHRMKETDRQMKETDRQMKETDRRLKRLDDLFTGQWGKLMEALVKGDLIKLLNSRGIEVNGIARDHERQFEGKPYEYDIIAINGEEIVVVEVKTTLRLESVNHFIKKLEMFKKVLPEYRDKRIYGGIAYLKANEGTDRFSESRGLFVIRAVGSSSSIINAEHFKPKSFCT